MVHTDWCSWALGGWSACFLCTPCAWQEVHTLSGIKWSILTQTHASRVLIGFHPNLVWGVCWDGARPQSYRAPLPTPLFVLHPAPNVVTYICVQFVKPAFKPGRHFYVNEAIPACKQALQELQLRKQLQGSSTTAENLESPT
ncbi:hypothetical protein HaLaN_25631 [Haematococcus lacustris]|uniref:Secreted protein n=1 Tax=Haematococcus lacustris TaxID=44745 RepID=A0A6A0A3P9_HAELA|nr:hypothetical protein HaLaN_25631 [Haematococcus lacustris]